MRGRRREERIAAVKSQGKEVAHRRAHGPRYSSTTGPSLYGHRMFQMRLWYHRQLYIKPSSWHSYTFTTIFSRDLHFATIGP